MTKLHIATERSLYKNVGLVAGDIIALNLKKGEKPPSYLREVSIPDGIEFPVVTVPSPENHKTGIEITSDGQLEAMLNEKRPYAKLLICGRNRNKSTDPLSAVYSVESKGFVVGETCTGGLHFHPSKLERFFRVNEDSAGKMHLETLDEISAKACISEISAAQNYVFDNIVSGTPPARLGDRRES